MITDTEATGHDWASNAKRPYPWHVGYAMAKERPDLYNKAGDEICSIIIQRMKSIKTIEGKTVISGHRVALKAKVLFLDGSKEHVELVKIEQAHSIPQSLAGAARLFLHGMKSPAVHEAQIEFDHEAYARYCAKVGHSPMRNAGDWLDNRELVEEVVSELANRHQAEINALLQKAFENVGLKSTLEKLQRAQSIAAASKKRHALIRLAEVLRTGEYTKDEVMAAWDLSQVEKVHDT